MSGRSCCRNQLYERPPTPNGISATLCDRSQVAVCRAEIATAQPDPRTASKFTCHQALWRVVGSRQHPRLTNSPNHKMSSLRLLVIPPVHKAAHPPSDADGVRSSWRCTGVVAHGGILRRVDGGAQPGAPQPMVLHRGLVGSAPAYLPKFLSCDLTDDGTSNPQLLPTRKPIQVASTPRSRQTPGAPLRAPTALPPQRNRSMGTALTALTKKTFNDSVTTV